MDNSRKHDSIGTKTHRTPPSAETPAASSDKPQTSMDHMATSSAEAVEMPNRPHHPVHTGGGGHDDGIVQNTTVVAAAASGQPLLSAATTGGSASAPSSTTATAAAAATSASAPTTTTNSAERALVLVEPKSTAMVLAKPPTAPFTQPPTVSAPPGAASASTSSSKTRPAVFNKLESLVQDMQDKVHGVPVRDQKTFLTSIPFAFMGYDLIEWLMDRLSIEDSLEAVHLANLLCQFGYYFPIGELKNLLVKDDSSLYRFQSPYYWPSQHHSPDNIEYAIYLAKRSQQRKKDKHALEDYELDSYNNLKKILSNRWDFVTMQSEEQLRQSKDRKRDDKQIIDSQERAYWRVYRPPPGYTTVVESSPVPTREQRVKARNRTREHISEEVKFLRAYASTSRSKVSQVLDNLIEYTETFVDFDPILFGVLPSNPWITDDQTYWLHNQPLVDTPTEKRVRKWEISLEDLVVDPLGVKELMEYMKKEYSHENLRFWLAVQELRYGPGTEQKIKKKVKEIWDEFLSPGAKSEINIDGRTLEATKVAMKTASRFTFEVAATHIYKLLLKNDCYPRFIRSENYKTILANAVNPTKRNTRIFNFPRVPRRDRPNRSGPGTSTGGTTGPVSVQGGCVKEDYANYGIYGATGQGDLSDSPPDGSEDPAYAAQNRTPTVPSSDAICPWDDDSLPPSGSTKSKAADDSTKKPPAGGHVRRGSDPIKSSTTPVTGSSKARLIHPTPTSTAAAIASSVLPLEAASAIVSSTSKVSTSVAAPHKRTSSTSSEHPTSTQTSSSNNLTLDPKATGEVSHEKHRHSDGGGGSGSSGGTGTGSSGHGHHHHHHQHHHHHLASKSKSRNRRSKKRIPGRASSSAGSASTAATSGGATATGNLLLDNEIGGGGGDCQQQNAENTSSKEAKKHKPPAHQHSAASLLTSVASASFAMASIEGLAPAVTTAAAAAASISPPTVTSGAVASATVALLPSSMGGDAASVMETKCTQTKLEDKELSDFLPAATGTATTTIITTTTTTSSLEAVKIIDAKMETATDVISVAGKPVDKPSGVAASNAAIGVGPTGHPTADPSGLGGVEFVPGGDNKAKKQSETEAIVVVTTATTTTSNPEAAVAVGAREQTANVTSTADGVADQQQKQPPASSAAPVIGAESKGELGTWTRSTAEVCPWEDDTLTPTWL